MPSCGAPPAGYVDRQIPGSSLCLWVSKTDTNLLNAPLYPQGQFVGLKPTATVVREYTDAAGRKTADVWSASQGFLGTVCLSNCGAGTGFFGLGGQAAQYARVAGTVLSQLVGAVGPLAPFFAAGSALASNVERSQKGMALNLGGILSSVGGILSGANFGDYSAFGQIAGAGLNIAGAALTPAQAQPIYGIQPMYGPIYSPPTVQTQAPPVVAQPVGAFGVAGRAIAAMTAPILTKIAVKLGLRARPSLTRAMELVRKAAKILQSPEAVAAALGITIAELSTLIVSSNARKRRRMNPANSKALRRAARRIKSFHRLCTHTDVLRGRGRARAAVRCGSCKKSPCRC